MASLFYKDNRIQFFPKGGMKNQYLTIGEDGKTIKWGNVVIPTKVSAFANDAGYVTADNIPKSGAVKIVRWGE